MSNSAYSVASKGGSSVTSFTGQTSITITHNWNTYPIVEIVDNTGAVLIPLTITHDNVNPNLCTATTVTFDVVKSGQIVLSYGAVPGPQGIQGPTGAGMTAFAGGTTAQALVKSSNIDYEYTWTTLQAYPLTGEVTTSGAAATISALAVTEGKIAALAVTEGKIAALSVVEGKIGALAVTEAKIGASAVTNAKIGSASVDYTKIAVGMTQSTSSNAGAYDFSTSGIYVVALAATTGVTFSNLQQNKTLKMKLTISAGATITFPTYCKKMAGSQTLGDGTFYLYFDCWNSTGGSELVIYSIMKE
jgi:hypothetical protein